jgi:hypothetical protein
MGGPPSVAQSWVRRRPRSNFAKPAERRRCICDLAALDLPRSAPTNLYRGKTPAEARKLWEAPKRSTSGLPAVASGSP